MAEGIVKVLGEIMSRHDILPDDVTFIAHGTTQATNALLEGDVAKVGILTLGSGVQGMKSKGDTNIGDIELAAGKWLHTYSAFANTGSKGSFEANVAAGLDSLAKEGAQSIVVSEAFSVDNPENENAVLAICREKGMAATAGNDVSKLYGLKVRTRTAVINASILPKMLDAANMTESSIKNADIGVGMGITGTDVTKNVADMVLADDNFATIVGAVEEGRRIYDNIRKAIQFLLGSNMSEVISIFVATLMGFTIMAPVHLLWINLVTDCFPALALGMEKAEPDVMRRKPRDSKSGIFSGGLGVDVAYQGILVSLLTLAAFFIGHFMQSGNFAITDSADGTTMAFLTMSMGPKKPI